MEEEKGVKEGKEGGEGRENMDVCGGIMEQGLGPRPVAILSDFCPYVHYWSPVSCVLRSGRTWVMMFLKEPGPEILGLRREWDCGCRLDC